MSERIAYTIQLEKYPDRYLYMNRNGKEWGTVMWKKGLQDLKFQTFFINEIAPAAADNRKGPIFSIESVNEANVYLRMDPGPRVRANLRVCCHRSLNGPDELERVYLPGISGQPYSYQFIQSVKFGNFVFFRDSNDPKNPEGEVDCIEILQNEWRKVVIIPAP